MVTKRESLKEYAIDYRMTTVLGLNDKILIYPSDNRIIASYEKKKKQLFMDLMGQSLFLLHCILLYCMSKNLNFLSLSF